LYRFSLAEQQPYCLILVLSSLAFVKFSLIFYHLLSSHPLTCLVFSYLSVCVPVMIVCLFCLSWLCSLCAYSCAKRRWGSGGGVAFWLFEFFVSFGGRGREGFEYLESLAECIDCYPTGSLPYGATSTYGLPYVATLYLRGNFGPVG
jgi:hypothetical protein